MPVFHKNRERLTPFLSIPTMSAQSQFNLTKDNQTVQSIRIASISWDNTMASSSSSSSSSSDEGSSDWSPPSLNLTPTAASCVFRSPSRKLHNEEYHTRHITSAGTLYASSYSPDGILLQSPRSRKQPERFRSWTADGNSLATLPLRSMNSLDHQVATEESRPWFLGPLSRLSLTAILYVLLIQSTTFSTTMSHPAYHGGHSSIHGREVPLETFRLEAMTPRIETKKLVHDKKFVPSDLELKTLVHEMNVLPSDRSAVLNNDAPLVAKQPKLRSKKRQRQPQLYMAKSNGIGPLFHPQQQPSLLLSSQDQFSPPRAEDSGTPFPNYYKNENRDPSYNHPLFAWCILMWCLAETVYKEWRRRSLQSHFSRALHQR